MTERIDHAAEAWKEWHHMDNPAHESLLHMLNALVEQQRIANLLRVHEATAREGNYDLAAELWNTEIKEALGL